MLKQCLHAPFLFDRLAVTELENEKRGKLWKKVFYHFEEFQEKSSL